MSYDPMEITSRERLIEAGQTPCPDCACECKTHKRLRLAVSAAKDEDYVRVLRLYEFKGPRSKVEEQITRSIHGEKVYYNGLVAITGVTLGAFPEIVCKMSEIPEA